MQQYNIKLSMTDRNKFPIPKLIQYVLRRIINEIKNAVFINGKAIILPKLSILHPTILIITKKAIKFGTSVEKNTVNDAPNIPHFIESG